MKSQKRPLHLIAIIAAFDLAFLVNVSTADESWSFATVILSSCGVAALVVYSLRVHLLLKPLLGIAIACYGYFMLRFGLHPILVTGVLWRVTTAFGCLWAAYELMHYFSNSRRNKVGIVHTKLSRIEQD